MQQPFRSSAKPQCLREDALAVLRRLREAGHVAYFAGGCVRDELLGLTPTDYDIATDAPPLRVRKLFSRTEAVGQAFGVILVRHRRSVVEVATFRTEGAYIDGRRPQSVQFTSAEEDARRRDFTINGLFLDPIDNRVIDYVGGREDLDARCLRAIGDPDERFAEDHLRLLRAVRFAARFELQLDPATDAAIRRHAPQLIRISPERIAEELRLMLCPVTRRSAWPMLWELRLVHQVFRFIPAGEGATFDPKRSIFATMAPDQPLAFGEVLAAAALCYQWQGQPASADVRDLLDHTAVEAAVRACRKALRISNDEKKLMRDTLHSAGQMLADELPTVAAMKRLLASPHAVATRRLLRAIGDTGLHRQRIDALEQQFQQLARTDVAPPPLISGDDLLAAGLTPGPVFKRVLQRVYDAQLEGQITTPQEAIALARREASAGDNQPPRQRRK